MRWTPGGDRSNVEDRRGDTPPSMGGGGGGGLIGMLAMLAGRRFGIIGVIVVLALGALFTRGMGGGSEAPSANHPTSSSGGEVAPVQASAEENAAVDRMTFVLNDANDVWEQITPRAMGTPYRDARLVLFRQAVRTGCGTAPSAVGPFYCPNDERVYLDLSFFDELRSRFGAQGDFAEAYVVAHELGHHVQKVTGTSDRVRQLQESRPDEANALSVRLELQADCYAGVWANTTSQRKLLEAGDVEEALGAASAVGDDRIQKQARGSVNPDSFTHGSAAQRATWFRRGFESGDPRSCDTFAGGI